MNIKGFLTSTSGIAIIHFALILIRSNGYGGRFIVKICDIIGQPGYWLSDGFGFGNSGLAFWITMILNSLVWGVVIGTLVGKFLGKRK